jgi:hypothetical protein
VRYANGVVKKARSVAGFIVYPKIEYGSVLTIPTRPDRNYLKQAQRLPVELLQALAYTSTTLVSALTAYRLAIWVAKNN